MRKHVRNQMIEVLISVKEGIQHVADVGIDIAKDVILDCSEAMMMVLSILEENMPEARFQEYKIPISKVISAIDRIAEGKDISKHGEEIFEIITDVGLNLLNDPDVKTNVVFMPYKSSMWDSMERIWKEAATDPCCLALVVPIPYYDKKPNGTLAKKHFEGKMFPEYVPIISYEDYDIEKHMPDVVYIQNPYDRHDRDTSVDPAYYSDELKKHTQKLVVVPLDGTADKKFHEDVMDSLNRE